MSHETDGIPKGGAWLAHIPCIPPAGKPRIALCGLKWVSRMERGEKPCPHCQQTQERAARMAG